MTVFTDDEWTEIQKWGKKGDSETTYADVDFTACVGWGDL